MRKFLINLAIAYLRKHGYITRLVISEYIKMIEYHNRGIIAGRYGENQTKYADLVEHEVRAYKQGMSLAEQTRIISMWEKKGLEMSIQLITCRCEKRIPFAGNVEPNCHQESDWLKSIKKYSKQGCGVRMLKEGEKFELEICECMENVK